MTLQARKKRHLDLTFSQITDLLLILQDQPLNMNQNSRDSSNQSRDILLVKEIVVPKDVGDMLESLINKAKEVGDDKSNITVVEPFGGTLGIKKIMIKNLNPEKIRKIEVDIAELMESSYSRYSELDGDNLHWLLI